MFNYLKQILQDKNKLKEELDASFNPFMLQRWVSMKNANLSIIVNDTTNRLHLGITDRSDWFKLVQVSTPSISLGHIKYIKKPAKNKLADDKIVSFIANNLEISKREAIQVLESNPEIAKNLRKNIGK